MWNYGDAGDRIPVRVGDVWRAGQHLFACGDLLDGIAERLFAHAGRLPDHVYCDPPWTKGNMSSFFTKAGQKTAATFEQFLSKLIEQMQPITGSVFIEMGF